MASSILAKTPQPEIPQDDSRRPYSGEIVDELIDLVQRVEKKPPQSEGFEITSRTDEERKDCNARMLLSLCALGEAINQQAFHIPSQRRLDPMVVALNGFPDVNTSRDYYDCAGRDGE